MRNPELEFKMDQLCYKNEHNYVFNDFFVIIENLGFGDCFRPYRKRDEPNIGSDDLISSI